MKRADYHIYVIQEHYDADIGASVQRWTLCGKSISRRIALYKARRRALEKDYAKIEVVRREYSREGGLSYNKIIWRHRVKQSRFALRLKYKTDVLRLKGRLK